MPYALSQYHLHSGFFASDNVQFIKKKVGEILKRTYGKEIVFSDASVKMIQLRIWRQQLQAVPLMNERVIMELTSEFRNDQTQVNKHLTWEEGYWASQLLYDPIFNKGVDLNGIKLRQHLGKERVGPIRGFVFM